MNRLEYQLAKNHKWSDLKLSEPVFAVVIPFNDGYGEPTVTTDPATGIGTTSAILNGTLVDAGPGAVPPGWADCCFEYGLDIGYGTTTPTQSKSTGETFSQSISGLLLNQTYHFRAFAFNHAAPIGHGADRTFRTLGAGNPNVDQLIYQHAERMKR